MTSFVHEMTCGSCGTPFKTRDKRKKYCGIRCSIKMAKEAQERTKAASRAWSERPENRVQRECENCSKPFEVVYTSPVRTCGRSCGAKIRSYKPSTASDLALGAVSQSKIDDALARAVADEAARRGA